MINTHKSMLVQTIAVLGKSHLVDNRLISRFMKGVFNACPPKPRYDSTWDVSVLLRFLETRYPFSTLDLPFLTKKLACLLALTTAQRAQTLVNLDISFMTDLGESILFTVPTLMKTSRPSKPFYKVRVDKLSSEKLCVLQTLREYMRRTEGSRKSSKLLVSFKPGTPVSTETFARWVKELMAKAGVDPQLKAHSVRDAATSAAAASGISRQAILNTPNWSSAGTFRTYYQREVQEQTFGAAVLTG